MFPTQPSPHGYQHPYKIVKHGTGRHPGCTAAHWYASLIRLTAAGTFLGERPANSEISQMPRHLISDAYEWINKIPSVPIYYLAKPQPRERAWQNQRGKKTLLSLTLV
ncbi:hypothetical protein T03_4358 [Trichinella britovi]|uniref:Uncharacterized protein n=1 Tax=Trichinella britovi TaxID=45882 RepID=A0A0V1C3L1_TRIBR|nr:hypothetical protein T03_4358 [Trichinella britovi]